MRRVYTMFQPNRTSRSRGIISVRSVVERKLEWCIQHGWKAWKNSRRVAPCPVLCALYWDCLRDLI